MTEPQYAYKMLTSGNLPPYGSGKPSLPRGDEPGDWMPHIEELVPCESGYHLVPTDNFRGVLHHRETNVFLVEYVGDSVPKEDTAIVVHSYRIIKQVMGAREWRLFAADCAERVLPVFEKAYPEDNRPRLAIEAARVYANNPSDENREAADAAAYAAAHAADATTRAVYAAAYAATDAARAVYAAADAAAYAAAHAADAAWAAAWAAAWDAERQWQNERLAWYLTGESFNAKEAGE